mgnify:CR=1 FL=1
MTVDRVNAACERAVDAGATSVTTVVGMVERALEADKTKDDSPPPDNVIVGRFARDASHFATGRKVTR